MTDLLELAMNAHGGLNRWRELSELDVRVSLTGPMYAIKGQPQGTANVLMQVDTREPAVAVSPFGGPGQVGQFRPERVWITDRTSKVVDDRAAPRVSFAGHVLSSQWDPLQLLYFNAYAMWNYLTTPFLFTRPGFALRELEPHRDGGDTWRKLHVTFPPDVPTHCPEQVFYFDEKGLLQRIDYVTDVAGGVAAHYCHDHTAFGGILFPTLRRVVRRTPERASPAQPTAILIQITDILVR
jgi:hypothetical protein